jgi:hypothetical protein
MLKNSALRFPIESRTVVEDGLHNAFTDLIVWQGSLWLVYVSSPSHFANTKSRIVLLHSVDGQVWQAVARFGNGEDIRDPKLAVVNGRLVVYALLNRTFDPRPYRTVYSVSADGQTWSPLAPAGPEGWLLGRPKISPAGDWYAPAHNIDLGAVRLFSSQDGLVWKSHAIITNRQGADETAIEFFPDGRLLAVTRIEAGGGLFGHSQAGTLLSVAEPPYRSWTVLGFSRATRLDGPALFTIGGQVYAVGRHQPRIAGPFNWPGSIVSHKRTSIFRVEESNLTWLSDLPSAGDTAYAGVALWNQKIIISYYTSDPRRDVSWIAGMLAPTSVRVVILEGGL